MNNNEVIADFRRRWEGTYVWLAMEGRGDELVYLNGVDTSSTKVATMTLTSDKIGRLTLNFGSEGHSLKFRYPPVGVSQFGRESIVFYRRPSRQYRRGLCGDNSFMTNVTRNLVGGRIGWSPEAVRAAFEHETYSIATALTLLEKGYKGVALDGNFSLVQSMFDTPDYVLFHWMSPVARVNTKGQVTTLYETSYKEVLTKAGFTYA